jgi:radical SAM superfamily enzyme YgiQ (UPF0313 family)
LLGKKVKSENKIALVRPNVPPDFPLGRLRPTVPLGLLVVAGSLREAGFAVTIIDDQLEEKGAEWVATEVRRTGASLAGVTVNLATVQTAAEICDCLQKAGISTFIGGPEVTANPEAALEATGAPFAVCGEGEETTVEFLQAFLRGQDLASVQGLAFRGPEGHACRMNERRPWIDLDTLPLLPYDLLPLERYDRSYSEFKAGRVEVLNTSRGCPFQCTFCSNKFVWSRQYRTMSPPQMLRHVRHALESTDATGIYFREDHFTLNQARVLEFCDLILEEGVQFEWGCESRVDHLTPALVQKMHQAGLRSIWFGIES